MGPAKNIYSQLGVKTLINAQGTVTVVGGSLMPPEVVQAMAEAAGWFVSIPELQEKCRADGSPDSARGCRMAMVNMPRPRRSRWARPPA